MANIDKVDKFENTKIKLLKLTYFLKILIFIYLAAQSLGCGMQTLSCTMWDLVP